MSFKFSSEIADCSTPAPFYVPEATVSPRDVSLSPQSMSTPPEDIMTPMYTPEPEKKTTKKRKSWGQELPTPKTNLPPRYVRCRNLADRADIANVGLGNVLRRKMRRSNVASSVSFVIVRPRNPLVSASVKRSKSWKARRWVSSNRTSSSNSDSNKWKLKRISWPNRSGCWQRKWPSSVMHPHPPILHHARDQSPRRLLCLEIC